MPRVTSIGDHRFLLSVGEGDELVEIRIYADQTVIERLGPTEPDEQRVVEAVANFLLERQRADDLPDTVDLEAVAAAYDDFFDDIRDRLGR